MNLRTDIKIIVKGSVSFTLWFNLWYSALELLKNFIDETFKGVKHHQLYLAQFASPDIHQHLDLKDTKVINNNDPSSLDDYSSSNQRFLKLDLQSTTNRKHLSDDNKLEFGEANHYEDSENNQDCVYIESMTNLFEIIEKVNRNETDLNLLIENINKICIKEGKTPFDKRNMTVAIPPAQLDSFSESLKSMKEGFAFRINFSLLGDGKK